METAGDADWRQGAANATEDSVKAVGVKAVAEKEANQRRKQQVKNSVLYPFVHPLHHPAHSVHNFPSDETCGNPNSKFRHWIRTHSR